MSSHNNSASPPPTASIDCFSVRSLAVHDTLQRTLIFQVVFIKEQAKNFILYNDALLTTICLNEFKEIA
jgi:hypothetical protein